MTRKSKMIITATLVVVLIAASLLLFWPKLVAYFSDPGKKIRDNYASNVYVLQNDFVYAITLDKGDKKGTILLVKNANNEFDAWQPGNASNRIYATAFMVDSPGIFITSAYAVAPWHNNYDKQFIVEMLKKNFGIAEENIQIKGYSTGMTIKGINDGNANQINCKPLGFNEQAGNEVGFIESSVNISNASFHPVKFLELLKGDAEKVYLLNATAANGAATFGINATKIIGLNKSSYHGYFEFAKVADELSEGAPVFNSDGKLLGVFSSYNEHSTGTNNINVTDIRSSTNLVTYFKQMKMRTMDESFTFIDDDTKPPSTIKEWKTLAALSNDSASDMKVVGHEEFWNSPVLELNNANLRLNIKINKLLKDNVYFGALKIKLIKKEQDGYSDKEEEFAIQYDKEGAYIENLWRVSGLYSIRAEGIDGYEFDIELQQED